MTDDGVVACPGCGRANRVPRDARGVPRCASCHVSLPWLVAADDGDFTAVAEQASVPVLVDLWAPWCGPCRMVAPAVEHVARELAGHLKVVKVNVDAAPGVAGRYQARSIPTLLLLRDGREIGRQIGALPGDRLLGWARTAVGAG